MIGRGHCELRRLIVVLYKPYYFFLRAPLCDIGASPLYDIGASPLIDNGASPLIDNGASPLPARDAQLSTVVDCNNGRITGRL